MMIPKRVDLLELLEGHEINKNLLGFYWQVQGLRFVNQTNQSIVHHDDLHEFAQMEIDIILFWAFYWFETTLFRPDEVTKNIREMVRKYVPLYDIESKLRTDYM